MTVRGVRLISGQDSARKALGGQQNAKANVLRSCSKQTRPPLVSWARIEAMPIPPPCWPDLRIDQESWSEAKQRLGSDPGQSDLAHLAQLAQTIKAERQDRDPDRDGAHTHKRRTNPSDLPNHREWEIFY
jgi:hypothetical protein